MDDKKLLNRFAKRKGVEVDLNTKAIIPSGGWHLHWIERKSGETGGGKAVMNALHKLADKNGKDIGLYASDRLKPYYSKLGYKPDPSNPDIMIRNAGKNPVTIQQETSKPNTGASSAMDRTAETSERLRKAQLEWTLAGRAKPGGNAGPQTLQAYNARFDKAQAELADATRAHANAHLDAAGKEPIPDSVRRYDKKAMTAHLEEQLGNKSAAAKIISGKLGERVAKPISAGEAALNAKMPSGAGAALTKQEENAIKLHEMRVSSNTYDPKNPMQAAIREKAEMAKGKLAKAAAAAEPRPMPSNGGHAREILGGGPAIPEASAAESRLRAAQEKLKGGFPSSAHLANAKDELRRSKIDVANSKLAEAGKPLLPHGYQESHATVDAHLDKHLPGGSKGLWSKLGGKLGVGFALGSSAYAAAHAFGASPAEASTGEKLGSAGKAGLAALKENATGLAEWGVAGAAGNAAANFLKRQGLKIAARFAAHAVPGVGAALLAGEAGKFAYDNLKDGPVSDDNNIGDPMGVMPQSAYTPQKSEVKETPTARPRVSVPQTAGSDFARRRANHENLHQHVQGYYANTQHGRVWRQFKPETLASRKQD
jgi:hypothetical protein